MDIMPWKWMEVDSNHRSNLQQIYSLSPLATRESIHIFRTRLHPEAVSLSGKNIPEYLLGIQVNIYSDIHLCPSAYLFNHSFT